MQSQSLHTVLARSYLAYFVASIAGLFVDTYIGFSVLLRYAPWVSAMCFLIGAVLIWWAQYTSRSVARNPSQQYFLYGPYRYMRNPTHLGIVILVLGYTIISGSIVFCGITILGYVISNIFFKKYERILLETHDGAYQTYQSKVPKIF